MRMHGKDGVPRQELMSVPEWKRSRELLARCTATPTLNLEEMEIWAIGQALRQTKGNLTRAAGHLGVVRDTLTNKMKKYGISKPENV